MLAQNFKSGRTKQAWREVNRRRGNATKKPVHIDGESDFVLISEKFKAKFSSITGVSDAHQTFREGCSSFVYKSHIGIDDLQDSICRLNTGVGHDGLRSNHL